MARRSSELAHAFTLLELLVVITIIAVLIGLIVPSLSQVRRSAGAAACLANMRQWSSAVIMYAQGNDGFLPRRGQGTQVTTLVSRSEDWFNALPPLMGLPTYLSRFDRREVPRPGERSIWMCPAAQASSSLNYFAYGMNMRLSTWQESQPDKIDRVAPPSAQVFLADAPGSYCSVLPSAQAYSPVARHTGGTNLAFLDGRAEGYRGEYVGCGVGDPRRGDVRWHVPGSGWPGPNQ